ncbi:hypothetical protein CPC197_1086, partial [Chlamydia psittaci C1/97]
APCSYFSNDM